MFVRQSHGAIKKVQLKIISIYGGKPTISHFALEFSASYNSEKICYIEVTGALYCGKDRKISTSDNSALSLRGTSINDPIEEDRRLPVALTSAN